MDKTKILLLKTLFNSTSSINKMRNTNNKTVKRKAAGALGIQVFLCVILAVYIGITGYGYGYYGMGDVIPIETALIVCAMSLIFTFLKASGYLFAYKEYDMLMAMPIEVSGIVWAKFMHMFILDMPYISCISLPMMVIYGYFMKPNPLVYPIWIVLSICLALIAEVAASILAALVSGIGAGFKHKKAVQTALTIVFTLACLGLSFSLNGEEMEDVENVLDIMRSKLQSVANIVVPAKWFGEAVNSLKPIAILLPILLALVLTEGFIRILGFGYRKINTKLTSATTRSNYKLGTQKANGVIKAIAIKEFRRLTSSTLYLVNAGLGEILTVILGICGLVLKPETIMRSIQSGSTGEIPMSLTSYSSFVPAIPLIVFMISGLIMTTCCSLSLEGKNRWIIKSMPIDIMTLLKGKMLFNLILVTPPTMFGILGLCFCLKAGAVNFILFEILGVLLCIEGTVRGMCCGVRFVKYDWVNEAEVVKQGAAVAAYMFPHMLIMILLISAAISVKGKFVNVGITLVFIVITVLGLGLDYWHLKKLCSKRQVL